ncbi:MAG: hypothetical protein IH885_06365 [Myxococcales bacterium]|nr:hypothetical protein [Myxococcales bacterium]
MIRRIRPSLRWFAVVAALLLVALPVQADDIEPEPYVEEAVEPEPEPEVATEYRAKTAIAAASNEPSIGSKIYDCAVLRPFGLAGTILGAAAFVPVAVLASASGVHNVEAAWEIFVVAQFQNTFTRPLGEF